MFGISGSLIGKLSSQAGFSPASLPLTWWTRGNFSSVPWNGVGSTGTSGSNNWDTSTGNDPTVGTALNGHNPAQFNGTNQSLLSSATYDNIVASSASSFSIVFKATAATADTGSTTWYDMPLLFGAQATRWGVVYSTSGVRFGNFNGSNWDSVNAIANLNAWHLVQGFHDGVNLNIRVDDGLWIQLARGATSLNTAAVQCGTDPDLGVNFFQGFIEEQIVSNTVLSLTDFDNIRSYVFDRYGVGTTTPDLTTLSLSGLWFGDNYNGTTTWTSSASAGTSGNSTDRDFTNSGGSLNAPSTGTPLNGQGTVQYDRSSSQSLATIKVLNDFVPTDNHKWSIGILLNVVDVSTNFGGNGSTYLNETYLGDAGGNFNLSAYSTGPTFTAGNWPVSCDTVFSTGVWVYVQARGSGGGNISARTNSNAWETPTLGSGIGNRASILLTGRGNTAAYINATIAVMWIADASFDDATFDYTVDAINAKYGLSL